jgi:hypothetical protein
MNINDKMIDKALQALPTELLEKIRFFSDVIVQCRNEEYIGEVKS